MRGLIQKTNKNKKQTYVYIKEKSYILRSLTQEEQMFK